jgi:hypothetical protein
VVVVAIFAEQFLVLLAWDVKVIVVELPHLFVAMS